MRILEIYNNGNELYTFWIINDKEEIYPMKIDYKKKEVLHESIYEYSIKKSDIKQLLQKLVYKKNGKYEFYNINDVKKNELNVYHTLKKHIHYGATVLITLKEDQGTDKRQLGIVKDVLTNKNKHPRGLKVRMKDGQIGRVQAIVHNNIIG